MKPTWSFSLLSLLVPLVESGDVTQWMTMTEYTQGPPQIQWSTTTCWSTKEAEVSTVTTTATVYSSVTTTVHDTSYYTATQTTTVTDYSTVTSTKLSPITNYATTTVYNVDTSVSLAVKTSTVYSTVYSTVPSVVSQVNTITITLAPSVETVSTTLTITSVSARETTIFETCPVVSQSSASRTLTTLVPCPSRIINTAYTPPTILPRDYTWGCPPGTICTPEQIDCNWERNLPADTYYCSPEQCKPVQKLPSLNELGGPHFGITNDSCARYIAAPCYINLDPTLFGLTYDIFQFGDNVDRECDTTSATTTPPPPTTTTTTTTAVPPPPTTTKITTTTTSSWPIWVPPLSSSTTTPIVYTPSSSVWEQWTPVPSSVKSSPTAWKEWSASSVSQSATASWGNWEHSTAGSGVGWQPSSAQPYGSHITPRAEINERQVNTAVPKACYKTCNACADVAEAVGKVSSLLCPSNGDFSVALAGCNNCVSIIGPPANTVISSLGQFVNYCLPVAAETQSPVSPLAEQTTSTATTPQPVTTPSPTPSPSSTASSPAPPSTTTPTTSLATTTPSSAPAPTTTTSSSAPASTTLVVTTSRITSTTGGSTTPFTSAHTSANATGFTSVSSIPPGSSGGSQLTTGIFTGLWLVVTWFALAFFPL